MVFPRSREWIIRMYVALWLEQVKGLLRYILSGLLMSMQKHVMWPISECEVKTRRFISLSSFFLGASPDNIFICNCRGRICVEYKCPFNIKEMSILEGRLKTDFLESHEGKIRLRRRDKYYTQVIGQMASSAGETIFCCLDNQRRSSHWTNSFRFTTLESSPC